MNYKLTSFFNRVTAGLYNFEGSEVDLIQEIESEIQNEIEASLLKRPQSTKNWLLSVYNEIERGQKGLQADYIERANPNTLEKAERQRITKNREEAVLVLNALDNIQSYILEAVLRIEPANFLKSESFQKAVKTYLPKRFWVHLEGQQPKDQAASQPEPKQPAKLIQISPSVIPLLFDCLKDYFSPEEHPKLEALLKGQHIEGQIKFLGNKNKLPELFKRLLYQDEEMILGKPDKNEIAFWLSAFFTTSKGELKDVYEALTKTSANLSKEKRLCPDLIALTEEQQKARNEANKKKNEPIG